jgi:hypothetical protein
MGQNMHIRDDDRHGMILGIVLFFGILICQSGCATYRDLHIVEEEKPATIFDRYELDILGGTGGEVDDSMYTVSVHLDFINAITDTMIINDIPILMIDTFCFGCEFMDDPSCMRMLTDQQAIQRALARGAKNFYVSPRIRDDLSYIGEELLVLGFRSPTLVKISIQCQFVNAMFTARLIDRVTGDEIARETKTVRIRIDKSKRLRSAS